jgi:hypothetical protein
LKLLGFEPFDEIIDYSFDNQDSVEKRGEILINSISDIVNCTNLNALYKKLYPKIEHNYNRALEIIHDINYIPNVVQERINSVKIQKLTTGPVEARWDYFIQNARKPKINKLY